MGFKLKEKENIQPLCKKCLCFDNRMGTFIGACITLGLEMFALLLVILDLSAFADPSFEIRGGFSAQWRMPFWKGFVSCDIVMIVVHIIAIIMSVVIIVAIVNPETYKIYRLRPVVKSWYVYMIMHIIAELGVSVYIYSFYGLAAWRLPFLVFTHMFYIIRFLLNVWFTIVAASYATELDMELYLPTEVEESRENLYSAPNSKSDLGYIGYADIYSTVSSQKMNGSQVGNSHA